jgi:hypothetical protein
VTITIIPYVALVAVAANILIVILDDSVFL